jgi:hypothetical protein
MASNIAVHRELRRRGIRAAIGGDFGLPWMLNGTNARDVAHFTHYLGYSPAEALHAATVNGAALMGRGAGSIAEGALADLLLVEGDPAADAALVADATRLRAIMKGGVTPFNAFQIAYVVADIDEGVAIAARRFALPTTQVTRGSEIETGGGIAVCHFALAFAGGVQIEIIQPAGGEDRVYRQMVAGRGLTLHHLGMLLDGDADWDAVIAENRRDGTAMPVHGDFAGLMRYVYFDRRAELGHFVEVMQASAAGATLFDAVPCY